MKAVVTGGGGFLGQALVQALLAEGAEVSSVSRGRYPELERRGVRTVRGDLSEPGEWSEAFRGADVAFHAAAKAGVWGAREEYFRTNVDGTRNVLAACREQSVPQLVHTSSPSVCFDGADHRCAGGDLPYATRWLAAYPESKAAAERLVLGANGQPLAGGGTLTTCVLRPHLIFGPGDPHLVPRLLERAANGQLAVVGRGDNEVSMTFVDNAAHAHLCAARDLAPESPHAGRAYFIANEQPVRLWDWINALLERLGHGPVRRRVPARLASCVGGLMELAWRVLRLPGEPRMTRFVAAQLSTSHSYDMTPAREDFGYRELVGMEEATDRLVASLEAEE